jgi:hypothetical protein
MAMVGVVTVTEVITMVGAEARSPLRLATPSSPLVVIAGCAV